MANELAWTTAEDALYDWIKAAIGALELRWSAQNVAQIEADFATLAITSVVPVGSPQEALFYDPARDAANQGIELRAGGPFEINITISVFAAEASDESGGITSAIARLTRARTILMADTDEKEALRAAGVTVSSFGTVAGLPVLVGADIQSRSTLEIKLYAQDFFSTFTTWIETIATVPNWT
jgi:hypothetical protein